MISDDRNHRAHDRERGGPWVAAIGATILAAWLAIGLARAEGSFFKDRREAAMTQPRQNPPPSASEAASRPNTVSTAQRSGETAGVEQQSGEQHSAASSSGTPPSNTPPAPVVPRPREMDPPQPQAPPVEISGAVSEVQTTDTLIVAGRRVQLAGVRGSSAMVGALQGWIVKNGSALSCRALGARYRCSTSSGKDVGQVVLQNGAGEADADAPADYRAAEAQARSGRRGIWAQR